MCLNPNDLWLRSRKLASIIFTPILLQSQEAIYATHILTANVYCRRLFGGKVYKLALSASTSCPNRDGTVGVGGCAFCSTGGSGDFTASAVFPVSRQIDEAKRTPGAKGEGLKCIAYFQSYTGTYGDLVLLERIHTEAEEHSDIVSLSIATRPDCLELDMLAMLERLVAKKPLWVELGLQTSNEETAKRINRGYPLSVYEKAMADMKVLGVHQITHIILGLPNEGRANMLGSLRMEQATAAPCP